MMTEIIPGFSLKNKIWAEEVRSKLHPSLQPHIFIWKHWETGNNDDFSTECETKNVLLLIAGNNVSIIAKSIGSFVTSFVVSQIPDQVDKLILCGIPLNDLDADEKLQMQNNLRKFPVERIICFQNTNDTHGSYADVRAFLQEINPNIKLTEKDRSDHEYPYVDEFEEFLLRQ